MIRVFEYLDRQGRSPYRAWFDDLGAEAAAKVAAVVYRLAEGEESTMALTRDFRETVAARAQRDPRFREMLFREALNFYLAGDTAEGKAILRDLVNATIGFERLAVAVHLPSKSLHRMLGPRGNPSSENFFAIVRGLQKKTHVTLRVTAKSA
jgi:hypothetical protein